MERFVRMTAPTGKRDFVFKLLMFMLIGGGLNHLRHVLTHGFPGNKSYWLNFQDAAFTTLPMCAFALLLIGHLNSLQKRLYEQATHDALTGLPNRRWFMKNTPDCIAPSQALMIIDIDHFKAINDQFGHEAGDACLCAMATHLRSILGGTNKSARIGGEEFAVFVPQASGRPAHEMADQISAGFLFDAGNGDVQRVTTSVGIAISKTEQPRAKALIAADKAVYHAKAKGRACYVAFDDDMARA